MRRIQILSPTELRIQRLEDEIKMAERCSSVVNRIEELRAKLHATPSPVEERRQVSYFVRGKSYKVPGYGAWKRWLEARTGLLPGEPVRQLCLGCGIPVAVSSADKTVIGSRGRKITERGRQSLITVGALIKIRDEEVQYTLRDPGSFWYEEVTRYIVATKSSLGCSECQSLYVRLKGLMERPYIEIDPRDQSTSVESYWRAEQGI